jgi:hypothetical protein
MNDSIKHALFKIYFELSLFAWIIESFRELREGDFVVTVVIKSGETTLYVGLGQRIVDFEQ